MASRGTSDIDTKIGEFIRSRRESEGMTQAQLGRALGVTFQQVQKYEKGTNRVAASTLALLADALNCHVSDFFGDPEPEGRSMSERSILRQWQQLRPGERDAIVGMIREFLKR